MDMCFAPELRLSPQSCPRDILDISRRGVVPANHPDNSLTSPVQTRHVFYHVLMCTKRLNQHHIECEMAIYLRACRVPVY